MVHLRLTHTIGLGAAGMGFGRTLGLGPDRQRQLHQSPHADIERTGFGSSGAVGLMILAVMTRASLGHTGRRLASPPAATAAYLLVASGALLRVIAAAAPDMAFSHELLVASGLLWAIGFAAFVGGYARMLTTSRTDGRPG